MRVNGLVPWRSRSANARNVGVVFGRRSQLWWNLPLIESLRLVGSLYDVPSARFETSLKKLRDLLGPYACSSWRPTAPAARPSS